MNTTKTVLGRSMPVLFGRPMPRAEKVFFDVAGTSDSKVSTDYSTLLFRFYGVWLTLKKEARRHASRGRVHLALTSIIPTNSASSVSWSRLSGRRRWNRSHKPLSTARLRPPRTLQHGFQVVNAVATTVVDTVCLIFCRAAPSELIVGEMKAAEEQQKYDEWRESLGSPKSRVEFAIDGVEGEEMPREAEQGLFPPCLHPTHCCYYYAALSKTHRCGPPLQEIRLGVSRSPLLRRAEPGMG